MNTDISKLEKLTDVARLYYEKDMNQSEIAKIYGVSRPLISRMLKEAKDSGIVKIEICPPFDEAARLGARAEKAFGIKGGVAVRVKGTDNEINAAVVSKAILYLQELHAASIGIGWGHIIGDMVSYMEKNGTIDGLARHVCPLIGNSGVGNRNYHSNELVRLFAQLCHGEPQYFYAPFLVASQEERAIIKGLEGYQNVEKTWRSLDLALVNIGNYPSVPDFASEARFGEKLRSGKAVGRILNYYLDVHGHIFQSENDYSLQIPLEILKEVPSVVGICSANTSPKALLGALRTGYIDHVIAPWETLKKAVETAEADFNRVH